LKSKVIGKYSMIKRFYSNRKEIVLID